MRILYLDIDTLRADHLGCYGYARPTTPNIDRLAADSVRMDNCYVSDAPCLPSRASMFTGRFGIHTGVAGHGGTCADPRPIGRRRNFNTMNQRPGFIWSLRQRGLYPVSFSPFAERHSAWWFCEGWREMVNSGRGGAESAEEIVPAALDWIARNARRDDWMLHINIWDPHTPYRAPEEFGNPFKDEPAEGWYTDALRRRQWDSFGPGSPQEPAGCYGQPSRHARQPSEISSMKDYRRWVDGYDCGIRYADQWCGRVLGALADAGVLDDTVVIVTSDHGEGLGELGVIGDHAVADNVTGRVPMIVRWPGLPGGRTDAALHYQTDVAATIIELAGGEVPAGWDGVSFADAFRAGRDAGRDSLVLSQLAWSCMRSVRWDDWLFCRTFHTGLKNLPARMLFNVREDPHELADLADARPDLAGRGQTLLDDWTARMLETSDLPEDPLWRVMAEGGPYHTRSNLDAYCARLRATGRARHAEFLEKHPTGLVAS
jgi:arylsulfatase A-like enzyme